eukprot:6180418-Pleurochrysis_carterae.AAC.3
MLSSSEQFCGIFAERHEKISKLDMPMLSFSDSLAFEVSASMRTNEYRGPTKGVVCFAIARARQAAHALVRPVLTSLLGSAGKCALPHA